MAANHVAQALASTIKINVNEAMVEKPKSIEAPSLQQVPSRPGSANSGDSKGSSYHSAAPVTATKIKRKLMAKEQKDFVPCEPPEEVEEVKTITYTKTRVETIYEGDPKP